METGNTYVYFALTGDNFDPQIVTDRIGVTPTETWKKGDKGMTATPDGVASYLAENADKL